MLLLLNKYVYMILGGSFLILSSFTYGYFHGKTVERNSQEAKQKIAIIENQSKAIDKLQEDSKIKDESIISLHKENDKLNVKNESIQDEIKSKQNIIDKLNRINGQFLRIIQDSASPTTMSKNAASPSGINGDSETYRASDALSAITNGFGQCNQIRNQLIELQNVIRRQVENANR